MQRKEKEAVHSLSLFFFPSLTVENGSFPLVFPPPCTPTVLLSLFSKHHHNNNDPPFKLFFHSLSSQIKKNITQKAALRSFVPLSKTDALLCPIVFLFFSFFFSFFLLPPFEHFPPETGPPPPMESGKVTRREET